MISRLRSDLYENWLEGLLDPSSRVIVDFDGIDGILRLPERSFQSQGCLQEHLFWYIVEGQCSGVVAGDPVSLSAGSVLWVSPSIPFRFSFPASAKQRILRFRMRIENALESVISPGWPYRAVASFSEGRLWFEKIVVESLNSDCWSSSKIRGLVSCLCSDIFRRTSGDFSNGNQESRLSASQQYSIAEFLAKNMRGSVSPLDISRRMGYSHNYFTRLFRQTYGVSLRKWILENRLQVAANYLDETDESVSKIGELCGFEDPYYFSRQFSKWAGASPSCYRKTRSVS